MAVLFIPVLGFLLFEAKSAYEYSVTFYIVVMLIALEVHFTVFFQKMNSLRSLIANYQEFIAKRKLWF